MNSNVALSIVVPIYNEEESLPFLVNQLLEVLQPMEETFELVLNSLPKDKSFCGRYNSSDS